ncbi:hypothetical protein [Bacillus siamensis]|uniref:hypothetical protein n=1 Tax=Bacillus TaxID=1386 RepID=UPI002DB7426D|nr:hypothetical protein [Bacillus siamensis]MEC3655665.1 hypothetical protein [Bacillus siamensis]MED0774100.1 hypothetical protein [Bacillus siamensis]MED0777949.1 hypothetical protein [Bacillus siamensis]MED0781878.1 hypothetical protein [Bacillus siamensis]MED0836467.1 hypothetical protein [Bacillus siamensis]
MILVKVLVTITLLILSVTATAFAFAKEKDEKFFSEMISDGSGILFFFGVLGLSVFKFLKFILPEMFHLFIYKLVSLLIAALCIIASIIVWIV